MLKALLICGGLALFVLTLSVAAARADNIAAVYTGQPAGTCVLNGGATATCTATVPATCRPICSYNSSALAHFVVCAVTGTTLTVLSATTLDAGTVVFACF